MSKDLILTHHAKPDLLTKKINLCKEILKITKLKRSQIYYVIKKFNSKKETK